MQARHAREGEPSPFRGPRLEADANHDHQNPVFAGFFFDCTKAFSLYDFGIYLITRAQIRLEEPMELLNE